MTKNSKENTCLPSKSKTGRTPKTWMSFCQQLWSDRNGFLWPMMLFFNKDIYLNYVKWTNYLEIFERLKEMQSIVNEFIEKIGYILGGRWFVNFDQEFLPNVDKFIEQS